VLSVPLLDTPSSPVQPPSAGEEMTREQLAGLILGMDAALGQVKIEDAVRVSTDGLLSLGECPGHSTFVYAKADDRWIEQQQLTAKVRLEPLDFDFCGPLEDRMSVEGYWQACVDWARAVTAPHFGFGAGVDLL